MIDEELRSRCQDAGKRNRQALAEILSENADTEYGRAHGFAGIRSAEEYRDSLPMTRYEDYEESIRRIESGEKGVLFSRSYEILAFCHTSGTTGKGRKLVPVTRRQMERYGTSLDGYPARFYSERGGKRLFQQVFRTQPGETDRQMLKSELLYRFKAEQGDLDYDSYVGGRALLFDRVAVDGFFARCFAALTERDLTVMEAFFQFDHLHFFTYLEENWERILQAIEDRRIPEDICLSQAMKECLLSLPVTERRLDTIRRECRQGFQDIARRLWPRLGLLSGISNLSLAGEDEMLDFYAGEIPRYHNYYMSTECYVGECLDADDYRYVMSPGNEFVEFLPEKEEGKTLLPHELSIGDRVEPVVTTFGGFYRYRMGDLLQICDFIGESPVFEVVGRRDYVLSVAGERTSVNQLENAAERLREDGVPFTLYCFGPYLDRRTAHYRMALAADEKLPPDDVITERLDSFLKEENPAYESLREMSYIDKPEIRVLKPDAYFRLLEDNHILAGNKKPVHLALKGFREWRRAYE